MIGSEQTSASILIQGYTKSGKSHSLKYLAENLTEEQQQRVLVFNCDNTALPFSHNFKNINVSTNTFCLGGDVNRHKITDVLDQIYVKERKENKSMFDIIIIDTFTYLMDKACVKIDLTEDKLVKDSNGRRDLRQRYQTSNIFAQTLVDKLSRLQNKFIIVTCHISESEDKSGKLKEKAAIRGSVGTKALESFFDDVIKAEAMSVDDIEELNDRVHEMCGKSMFDSDLLTDLTYEEKEIKDYKHVFKTVSNKYGTISATSGLWNHPIEYVVDNSIWEVMRRLIKIRKVKLQIPQLYNTKTKSGE